MHFKHETMVQMELSINIKHTLIDQYFRGKFKRVFPMGRREEEMNG